MTPIYVRYPGRKTPILLGTCDLKIDDNTKLTMMTWVRIPHGGAVLIRVEKRMLVGHGADASSPQWVVMLSEDQNPRHLPGWQPI